MVPAEVRLPAYMVLAEGVRAIYGASRVSKGHLWSPAPGVRAVYGASRRSKGHVWSQQSGVKSHYVEMPVEGVMALYGAIITD